MSNKAKPKLCSQDCFKYEFMQEYIYVASIDYTEHNCIYLHKIQPWLTCNQDGHWVWILSCLKAIIYILNMFLHKLNLLS